MLTVGGNILSGIVWHIPPVCPQRRAWLGWGCQGGSCLNLAILATCSGVERFSVPRSPSNFLASWVTRRSHVQCFWLPGHMWSKQRNSPQGFLLLLSDSTPLWIFAALQAVLFPRVGGGSQSCSQGWRKVCYISSKKRFACHVNRNQIWGQLQRQCSYSWAAAAAWRDISEPTKERVPGLWGKGLMVCWLGGQPMKESFFVFL